MLVAAANLHDATEEERRLVSECQEREDILFCVMARFGLIRSVNRGFTTILDWTEGDRHHITWPGLMHPDDLMRASETLAKMDYYVPFVDEPFVIRDIRIRSKFELWVHLDLYIVGWVNNLCYAAGERARELFPDTSGGTDPNV